MRVTVIAVGVLLLSTGVLAQSLADAARAAEAASERNRNRATPAYTDQSLKEATSAGLDDGELTNFDLTMPLLRRHFQVHESVLQAESADISILRRVVASTKTAKNVADVERVFSGEPALLRVIEASGQSLHDYVRAQMAIGLAAQAMAGQLPDAMARQGKIRANAAMMFENQAEVLDIVKKFADLETQLAQRAGIATP
jgi:hypothetical protein